MECKMTTEIELARTHESNAKLLIGGMENK